MGLDAEYGDMVSGAAVPGSGTRPRLLRAGAAYFAIVFAVGALLGPIRELMVSPRLGSFLATALEAPVMIAASLLASRWIVRRWRIPFTFSSRLGLGLAALALLAAAEVAGALLLRGMSLAQYAAHLAGPAGLLSLALFAVFAAAPLLVGRR